MTADIYTYHWCLRTVCVNRVRTCVYLRLQYVCVLSLGRAVLPVREVVGKHGVDQLTHLLLLPAAEELRVHLAGEQRNTMREISLAGHFVRHLKSFYLSINTVKKLQYYNVVTSFSCSL